MTETLLYYFNLYFIKIIHPIEQNMSALNSKVDELRDVVEMFMEYQTILMQQADGISENQGTYIHTYL